MQIEDLRKLSENDLKSRLVDNLESLQKYRFQKSIQQLEDYKLISEMRKENAKINTILKEVSIKDLTQIPDGLNIAQTYPLIDPEVDDQALLAEFSEIPNILSQLVKHPRVEDMQIDIDFNSADSVAYHLAGLIPIPWSYKQNLLEAFDATQRLNILSKYIEDISSK